MPDPIPLIDVLAHRSRVGEEIDDAMAAVVAHGGFIMGPEVGRFESAATDYIGGDVHAIACANGTDALVIAMQALGLEPGDGVICPAFTFVATAEAVAVLGGRPIFADVEDDGFNLSVDSVKLAATRAIAAGIPVKGICAVDLFGVPAAYDELAVVADELGCWLMADAAQSFGARQDDARVGSMAAVTTTSFFPAKPLGCYGDGGMIVARDEELAKTIVSLRQHGKGTEKYDNVRIGHNSRLDTLQAAVLLPKLRILDDEIAARQRVADAYNAALADVVTVPRNPQGCVSAWAQYTVVTEQRDRLQSALRDEGIGCAVYYPTPLHAQTGYRSFHEDGGIDLPRSEWLSARVLSLPMHPYLAEAQIERVAVVITTALAD